jgi:hypothetical protein
MPYKNLGFYSVNNIHFESKIEACIYANKINQDITWNFHKEFFDRYPWGIEPSKTLDELYDVRARQLRDEYDYIMISYSGGADSHNLLMAFLRQNLHVDEIVVNHLQKGMENYRKPVHNDFSPENALQTEFIFQTIPRLKEIEKLSPKTKISIFDLTDYLFNFLNSANDGSWILKKREKLNPINITRFNYLYFSEVRKQFDKDKKIAVVMGVEKPRLAVVSKTNDLWLRFTDSAANIVSVVADHLKDYPNASIEYFYWSPDAVDIICKQCYVVKRWLLANPEKLNYWTHGNITKEVFRLYHERIYREILYTTWDTKWFQADKAVLDWYTEFDDWFINGYQHTKLHSIWTEGLNYVADRASKFIVESNGRADGLQMLGQNHRICNLYD